MIRVSASKLKLWEQCPKQYYYRYVVLEGKEPQNIYGLSGSAIHKAIERYYTEQRDPVLTYQEALAQHTFENTDFLSHYGKIVADAQKILQTFPYDIYKPIAHELYFSLPYPKDNPICTINGYIDMITSDGVIDFKTGKETVDVAYVEQDLQFLLYAYVFTRLYDRLPEYVIYHRLRSQEQIIARVFDFDRLHIAIINYLEGIKEQETNIPELIPCANCPFYCGVRKLLKKAEG